MKREQNAGGEVPSRNPQATLDAARKLCRLGWKVLPIPHRKKEAVLTGWPTMNLKECDLPAHFSKGGNLGILLGKPSGGLVDIDIDCKEALVVQDDFLPTTSMIHGRKGNPSSHRWYLPLSEMKTEKFQGPNREMLVEIRSTGGQTLVPPSTHPEGEVLEWATEGRPAQVECAVLRKAVSRLAACALLAQRWPAQGGRQDAALALSGALAHAGWGAEESEHFVAAVAKAAGDEEAGKRAKAASRTVQRVGEGLPATGGPTLAKIVGADVVTLVSRWLAWPPSKRESSGSGADESNDSGSAATRLVELVMKADVELFQDNGGRCFLSMKVDGHLETWALRSPATRKWLTREFYKAEGGVASDQTLNGARGLLEAKAQFDNPRRTAHMRVAEGDKKFYLDLVNDAWEAVEITPAAWSIVANPEARFYRGSNALPLPRPERGGKIDELRRFINVADERQWRLLVAWLLMGLCPRGPFPLLILQGEQGSAKSTAARILKSLIDPSSAPLRCPPREARDLAITCAHAWLIVLDNLSGLQEWLADFLCRLSTGGGFATRRLCTDEEEVLFDAMRPLILNGIDDLATRADLADRAIVLTLPTIPESARLAEADLWGQFESARPRILGALLDTVSAAMRGLAKVKLPSLPRMADFARWATAAEEALGWPRGSFIEAYSANREEMVHGSLGSDPVADAIFRRFNRGAASIEGTATEILRILNSGIDPPPSAGGNYVTNKDAFRRSSDWPGNPKTLANRLKRLAPLLRARGIEVIPPHQRTGKDKRREWVIRRLASYRPGRPDEPPDQDMDGVPEPPRL